MADALGAAHSVGIIHKDVNPANVLVHIDKDGEPEVRLTDFGIGQLANTSTLLDANITMTGFGGPKTMERDGSETSATKPCVRTLRYASRWIPRLG